jgi:hypothetical protein
MHHDIETSLLGDDLCDRRVGGDLRTDVEFEGMQVDMVVAREFLDIGDLRGIAAFGVAHRGVDRVPRSGQRVGEQPAEAAGSTGDDDNLFHDAYPFAIDQVKIVEGGLPIRPCRHWRAAPGR